MTDLTISYAYIEHYVGMAKMVAYWHIKALGFELRGYFGPETTGVERISYLLGKGAINLMITSASDPSDFDLLSFVDRHGNGVKRVAYHVEDPSAAYERAVSRGALPLRKPSREEGNCGYIEEAAIQLLDRNEILFFNNQHYGGLLRPGFEPISIVGFEPTYDSNLQHIDHITFGVNINASTRWCQYMQNIFGGAILEREPQRASTDEVGLKLQSLKTAGNILNVFVEPSDKDATSQVEVYLRAHRGSGVQHLALHTADIFSTVRSMRMHGIDFISFPDEYYDFLAKDQSIAPEVLAEIRECRVLCDKQGSEYLFQTFTKPFGDRPTFFYEIIQRTPGYEGFAADNIAALFSAVEASQAGRGRES